MDFSPWGIIFTYKFLFYNLVRIFLSHCFMGPTGIKLSFLFKFIITLISHEIEILYVSNHNYQAIKENKNVLNFFHLIE